MQDIFLSYGREDEAAARILAESLVGEGFSVWIDNHIPPGKTWDEVIGQALASARAVIVLWSSHSVTSRWVREEAERGLRKNGLIPVLIEDVEPPLGFGRIEAANLIGWDGDASNDEYQALTKAIRAIISAEGGVVPPVVKRTPKKRPQPKPPAPDPKPKKRRWPLVVAIGAAVLIGIYAIPWGSGYDDPYQFVDPDLDGNQLFDESVQDMTDVQIAYTGDNLGCTLDLSVSVDGVNVVPASNPFTIYDVDIGLADYLITGTISCAAVGACQAYGEGSIPVRGDYQTFQLSWQNTGVGQCGVILTE